MPAQANGDNLLIGRGKWYIDRLDASGDSTGLRFLGEADKAEMTPNVTTVERYTTTKASNNKIADVVTQQKHTLAIELMEFTKENLALAFLGESAALSQTTAPVTAEAVTGLPIGSPLAGLIFQTAQRGISDLVVTAMVAAAPVVMAEGTDYEIEDAASGLVRILSTVADTATAISLGYTSAAISSYQVLAGMTGKIVGKLVFVGDPTNGPGFDGVFWKCKVTPAGAIAFLSDDFTSMPLTAEVLDDGVHDDVYRITYR